MTAREGIDITHVRQLRAILKIDSTDNITRTLMVRRNMIFSSVIRDIATLQRTWNLTPTYDATLRYTPYLQKYNLSCEIAALSMVLSALGYPQSEDSLIADLPQFPVAYSGGIWGDPDSEFVGSITGSQMARTGYGVYPLALARILPRSLSYDIFETPETATSSREKAQKKLSEYLSRIESGAHVILWGDWCTSPEYDDGIVIAKHSRLLSLFPIAGKNQCERPSRERQMSWKTLTGKEVRALSGEHAFILLGYIGPRIRPTHIIVWDTDTGRHIYPMDEWMRKWGLLDYRALEIHEGV